MQDASSFIYQKHVDFRRFFNMQKTKLSLAKGSKKVLKFWWSRNEESSLSFGRQPLNLRIKRARRGVAWRKDEGSDAQVHVSWFTWKYHHFIIKKQTQIISYWSSVSPQFCCVDVDVKQLWRSDNLRVPAAPPVAAGMDSSPPMTLIRNKWLKEDGWVSYISAFSAVLLFPVFQLPIFYFFLPSLFCHLSR